MGSCCKNVEIDSYTFIEIVEAEEELEGEMPQYLYDLVKAAVEVGDKDAVADIWRATVKTTKNGIIDRMRDYTGGQCACGKR